MDIAIIGMDGRFPGAADSRRLWSLVLGGASGLVRRSDEPHDALSPPAGRDQPGFVPVSGPVGGVDCFDAEFFGYTPREAALLDPQQRLFLEICWRALEDAGQHPSSTARIGVFAGAGPSTYLLHNVAPALVAGDETDNFLAYTANDKDFLATRVAFKLDLQGPAITVQTACSTALVAVHVACQSLLLGECDIALAGGVTVRVPDDGGTESTGYVAVVGGIESPDGSCRPFDAAASGTVFANGAGVVVLKHAAAARVDGDRIYALIKGTAVNNDGAAKAGFTAPSAAGQASVIAEALAVAGADPASIAFVETHGTGTALGDAVELAGLRQVFGDCPPGSCGLGAVKANIGHTDVAAGIAGLMKAALSLHHGVLPPLAHWRAPGPGSHLESGPLFVPTEARRLHPRDNAVRAGVSAFGIGGTNAHLVLESASSPETSAADSRPQLLVWSARSTAARARQTAALGKHMETSSGPIADAAWTLQTGRAPLAERAALAVLDEQDAVTGLTAGDGPSRRIRTGSVRESRPKLAFLFPGQGAQFSGMGAAFWRDEPVFAATIDAAAAQLRPSLGFDLREVLFPSPAESDNARARLRRTAITQPAMFTVSVAMLRLVTDWGLVPDVVLGHSLGEYTAMVAAGVLDFEAALELVAARGRLMQALPEGRMAAVLGAEDKIRRYLTAGAEIAAINGPNDCVVSGTPDAVAATIGALERAGIVARPLETSHAFHSAMLEPMLPEFARLAACQRLGVPRIPLISNLTGGFLTGAPSVDDVTSQIRRPVRFADGVTALQADGPVVAMEVGPGTALAGLVRRQGMRAFSTIPAGIMLPDAILPATLSRGGDRLALLDAVGALWCEGFDVNWPKLHHAPRRRVDLPLYPFEPTRHWIEPASITTCGPVAAELDIRTAGWRRHQPAPAAPPAGHWAVTGADRHLSSRLAQSLRDLGATADVWCPPGRRDAPRSRSPIDGRPIDGLIILTLPDRDLPPLLTRAFAGGQLRDCLFLLPGLAEVLGTETLEPATAMLSGLALALARERPEIAVRIVDPGEDDPTELLPSYLTAPMPLSVRRGRATWVPDFPPLVWPRPVWPAPVEPRRSGAWLVIGATGLVGRAASAAIAGTAPDAPLYLASRSGCGVPGNAGEARTIDLTDPRPHLNEILNEIVTRHGRLAGIIFAAGSPTAEAFAAVTEPPPETYRAVKGNGLAVLAAALKSVPCETVLVCGSIAGWLGGIGYGSYAGVNAAAASIARTANRGRRTRWITLTLDAIAGSGTPRQGLAEISERGLTNLFSRLISTPPAMGTAEVIVSAEDFPARYAAFAAAIGHGAPPSMANEPLAESGGDLVQAAWRAVLGTLHAADDDSFFALGGSSLQALQLLSRIRRETGAELPLATFLEAPTLAALRARIGMATPPAPYALAETSGRPGPAPLSKGQLSLWLAEQRAETAGRFNVVELYRLEGPLDPASLRTALVSLEARHDGLRTRFFEHDGAPAQVVDPPGRQVLFEERIEAAGLEARLADEVHRRVDLAAAPAWRVILLHVGTEGRFLLLSAHHILLDDWSIGLFLEELADAYDQARAGRARPPEPGLRGFAAFCWAQAELGAGGAHEQSLAVWQRRLAGAPRRLAFGTVPGEADGALRVRFDGAAARDLRALGEKAGTSLFTVLLAAYKISVAAETGGRDIVTGTPLAGRPPGNWDRVLGYFVNPAAIRADLSACADFAALVASVKAAVIEAAAHDQVPYEEVAARLGAGRGGLFNVWFTILTYTAPRAMAGGLRLVPTRLGPRPSRFDLALVLEPDGDGLTGWLEYAGNTVGQATAARIAARIETVTGLVIRDLRMPLVGLLGRDPDPDREVVATAQLSLTGRARRGPIDLTGNPR
jgi:acyl transferase domain-containing protein